MDVMKYPEWAPPSLVELHKKRIDTPPPDRESDTLDPDPIDADLAHRPEGIVVSESLENFRRHLNRTSLGLPYEESTALLGKLITDLRMKKAWKTLVKRTEKDIGLYEFFSACEGGITGWRGDLKQTAAERKTFYQDIRDTALKLASLLNKADQFDRYSINEIVVDRSNQLSYARPVSVYETSPHIREVLLDISEKATQYGGRKSLAKKPNSENADMHYFIRMLSQYIKNRYRQPLHEVVAATTEVVFDRKPIDTDYVRSIVG